MATAFDHGYALLIGVGICCYPKWSLPVTVKDIQALHTILIEPSLCAYPDNEQHVQLLHDELATRHAILGGLAWLARQADLAPQATAVVYYSGHGWFDQGSGRYYLIPHDVNPFDLAGSALEATDFNTALRQIKAERLLVFMDCCHAEGMATSKGELTPYLPPNFVETALPKVLVDDLKQGKGRAVFTSSRGEQRSWIRPDQNMSVYTYHLCEALQGAGNQIGDTVVHVSNLMSHLGKAVPASAQQLCHAEQTPFFDTAAEDFAVALLRGGKGLPAGGWETVKDEVGVTLYRKQVARQFARLPFQFGYLSEPLYLDDIYFDLPVIKPPSPDVLFYPLGPGQRLSGELLPSPDWLFQHNKTAALVGILGMGKSTTLRHLAWVYAQRPEDRFYWRLNELIPFYASVRRLGQYWSDTEKAKGPEGFIYALAMAVSVELGGSISTVDIVKVLHVALHDKVALVLLDALDEFQAPDAERGEFIRALQNLWVSEAFRENSIILTSRPYRFLNPYGFQMYNLQFLERDAVDTLVFKLGQALLKARRQIPTNQIRPWLRKLNQAIHHPRFEEFWTPLYVTLLVHLGTSKASPEESIALLDSIHRLTDLYNTFFRETIEWEKQKGNTAGIDEYELKRVFAYIAYYTFVEPQKGGQLEQLVAKSAQADSPKEVRTIVKFWLNTGLLTEDKERETLMFRHSGFQYYGVAFALVDLWHSGQHEKVRDLCKRYETDPEQKLIVDLFIGLSRA